MPQESRRCRILGREIRRYNRSTRPRAAEALGIYGADAEDVAKALLGCLDDQNQELRKAAADALGKLGVPLPIAAESLGKILPPELAEREIGSASAKPSPPVAKSTESALKVKSQTTASPKKPWWKFW